MSIKVSVIIPLYNKAQYIERALNALYRQTHSPYEIIVVDDASTDGGADIARHFFNKHNTDATGIHSLIIFSEVNRGPGHARNIGLKEASGDFVSFLDADDEYHPELLKRVNEAVQGWNADMIILGYRMMPDNVIRPAPETHRPWLLPVSRDLHKLDKPLMFVFDRTFTLGPGSNAIARRSLIKSVAYDETSYVFEGIDFWFRVLQTMSAKDHGVYLLTGPYHTVHKLPDSLIRKNITFNDIQPPRLLSRYAKSNDIYERQLTRRIGKIWFFHDLSRIQPWPDKIRFIWKFRYILWVIYLTRS